MKKTILIPTDFSIESLTVLKNVLSQSSSDEKFDVILLHGVHLTDSITDLLFLSKKKIVNQFITNEFTEACSVLQNKYASKINSIRKDIFTGFTQTAFNNYVEGNKIDQAFLPTQHQWRLNKRKSFDLVPFIQKSKLSVEQVGWNANQNIPEKGKVAEIFFNGVPSHS
ncbi:MAG TPA: hypothetical protein PLL09_10440 [Flavobacterium sp.]|uniref:hypothetical protein n=1 Tax=unclassified Flavobacterium TaxID=196869 RepID=UPI0025BEF398|nr:MULTISPECIES: hypothetical protein [unclassified Flavobacterium]HRE78227.1 hypothetical protein [Flavobacterium sp.]